MNHMNKTNMDITRIFESYSSILHELMQVKYKYVIHTHDLPTISMPCALGLSIIFSLSDECPFKSVKEEIVFIELCQFNGKIIICVWQLPFSEDDRDYLIYLS